jgi:hypothetical protein
LKLTVAALQQMGYRFSPTFVNNLLTKYDAKGEQLDDCFFRVVDPD